MSDQYTPTIASAQTYLTTLHTETITRQEHEIRRLRGELAKAQGIIGTLSAQVRDLKFDITMTEPRQPIINKSTLTKTQRVEQMAAAQGVSVSTMWRRIQSGKIELED